MPTGYQPHRERSNKMKSLLMTIAIGANLGALIGVYTAGNEALSDYAPAGIAVTALASLTALAMKASK